MAILDNRVVDRRFGIAPQGERSEYNDIPEEEHLSNVPIGKSPYPTGIENRMQMGRPMSPPIVTPAATTPTATYDTSVAPLVTEPQLHNDAPIPPATPAPTSQKTQATKNANAKTKADISHLNPANIQVGPDEVEKYKGAALVPWDAPGQADYSELGKVYDQQQAIYKPLTRDEIDKMRRRSARERIVYGIGDMANAITNLAATSQYAPNMYDPNSNLSEKAKEHYERLKAEREAENQQFLQYALAKHQLGKDKADDALNRYRLKHQDQYDYQNALYGDEDQFFKRMQFNATAPYLKQIARMQAEGMALDNIAKQLSGVMSYEQVKYLHDHPDVMAQYLKNGGSFSHGRSGGGRGGRHRGGGGGYSYTPDTPVHITPGKWTRNRSAVGFFVGTLNQLIGANHHGPGQGLTPINNKMSESQLLTAINQWYSARDPMLVANIKAAIAATNERYNNFMFRDDK